MATSYSCSIFDYKAGGDYCCPKRCFYLLDGTDEVDGLACKTCQSYGRCYCKCKSYMKWFNSKNPKYDLILKKKTNNIIKFDNRY